MCCKIETGNADTAAGVIKHMKKLMRLLFYTVLVTTTLLVNFTLYSCNQEKKIEINVSPNVLNLESNGGAFSIHSNLKYSADMDVKVYIDNDRDSVPVLSTSADSRGELIVTCDILDIKEILSVGSVVIELTVHTKDGALYSGTDTIDIINRGK